MRIAVIGPQNTGKSTFIKDFLAAFPSYATPPETYRDVAQRKRLKINRKGSESSQGTLRDFLFDQSANFKGKDVIFDRSVIDNYIYTRAQHEKGLIGAEFVDETERIMHDSLQYLDAFIFIPTAAGIVFVEDLLRDTNRQFADEVNMLFIETLLSLRNTISHPIVIISGPRETRIELVRKKLGI